MDYKLAKAVSAKAGQKQEKEVAFYLRRAFKDHDDVFVINDFKFIHNNETAQIDHLIIYRFGFVLIESKSITGNVRVNKQEEWSRSYLEKWQGIPSPIKQAELQQKLLKELLHEHRSELVGTLLGIQQTLGNRCWHQLCAVSSNGIIERDKIPSDISKKLVKSEFLTDSIIKLIDLKSDIVRTLSVLDNRPAFNKQELQNICDFLLERCGAKQLIKSDDQVNENITIDDVFHPPKERGKVHNKVSLLECKKCHDNNMLTPMYGKFGYYVKCGVCEGNTSLKRACTSCESKQTKVSKLKDVYTLKCLDCISEEQLFPILTSEVKS
jgi:hypothetical protein